VEFRLTEYSAGKGMEYFIEAVDKNDRLYGFVRLRITSVDILEWLRGQKLRGILMSNLKSYGLIRELHVYGPQIEIGKKGNVQHQGIGTKLMEKAEIIAQENKVNYLAVISGVGVREYYRKMGYELKESYMVKYFLVNALKN